MAEAFSPDAARARRRLLAWYRRHGRDFFWRDGPQALPLTPFQLLLVEFLLWKTSAERSHARLREIALAHPGPEAVLGRSEPELEDLLRPLGLWRRRARCLAAFSRELLERHEGEVPKGVAELQRLTGIGQYAARATACVLHGSRLMPIDANTTRIFGRVFDEPGPDVRRPSPAWDARLDPFVPKRRPRRFLWATMDLAALRCRPREPDCPRCPLREDCSKGRMGV